MYATFYSTYPYSSFLNYSVTVLESKEIEREFLRKYFIFTYFVSFFFFFFKSWIMGLIYSFLRNSFSPGGDI